MNCFCKTLSQELILESDSIMDPICCKKCGCSLETDEFKFSEDLKTEIRVWLMHYEQYINNKIKPDQLYAFHKVHNTHGLELTKRIQQELGDKYNIEYYNA